MKFKKHLVLILLIAFLFRFSPVFLHEMPLSYDTPYHERMAAQLMEEESVPKTDPSLGGRPNIYPPLYSITLVYFSQLSALKLNFLAMVLLPFFSTLIALSVFVFLKRTKNEKSALIGGFLAAIASPLILAAFDSPENIVFFLLPMALLLFSLKRELLSSLLFASFLLWNYFIAMISVLPILFVFKNNKKALGKLVCSFALVVAFYFAVFGMNFLQNQNLSIGIEFIAFNLRNASVPFFVLSLLVAVPVLFFSLKEKLSIEQKFFQFLVFLSAFLLLAGLMNTLVRPWEQLKFIALGSVVVLPLMASRNAKKFLLFFAALLFVFSLLISFQAVFPRATKNDLQAIHFLESLPLEGRILAAPSLSEWISVKTGLDERMLASHYFENEGKQGFLSEALYFLRSQGKTGKDFLEKSSARFLLFNFEDEMTRGTRSLEERNYFNKIYSLNYKYNCPLSFIPKEMAYVCGQNETKILEFNEFQAKQP